MRPSFLSRHLACERGLIMGAAASASARADDDGDADALWHQLISIEQRCTKVAHKPSPATARDRYKLMAAARRMVVQLDAAQSRAAAHNLAKSTLNTCQRAVQSLASVHGTDHRIAQADAAVRAAAKNALEEARSELKSTQRERDDALAAVIVEAAVTAKAVDSTVESDDATANLRHQLKQ